MGREWVVWSGGFGGDLDIWTDVLFRSHGLGLNPMQRCVFLCELVNEKWIDFTGFVVGASV